MSTQRISIAKLAATTAMCGLLVLGSSPALAKKGQSKWPIAMGEVTKVDAQKQVIEIKDADGQVRAFRITPQTEMETERERPVKFVWRADFSDLKEGQWVRIKFYGSGEPKIARDIDIYLNGSQK